MSGSGARAHGPNLQSSISENISSGPESITGMVGSRKDYAATVHQGSRPHFIRAGKRLLKFEWERGQFLMAHRRRKAGRFFYFAEVKHPGNKRPVRFLTTPLHMYGRMNGFRTTSIAVSRSRLP